MDHFKSNTSENLLPHQQEKLPSVTMLSNNNATASPMASSSSFNSHYYHSDYNSVVSPPLTPAISPSTSLFLDNNNDNTNNHAYNKNNMNSPISNYGGGGSTLTNTASNIPIHPQHKHVCHYDFCGWSFKRYEHLKRHHLVHTRQRPHVCQFPGCGKSFSRSDNYHAHYRTHTKTRKKKKGNNVVQQQTTKSAAVTTAPTSAAVPVGRGVTSTKNDSKREFPFSANQQFISIAPANDCVAAASATAASNVAATAAVVAVSQPYNTDQQVFYNTPQPFYHNTTANAGPFSSSPSDVSFQVFLIYLNSLLIF